MKYKFKRIGNYRTDHDNTQKEIATILKVNRSNYSKWEYGINYFPLNKLLIFVKHYDISIDYLIELSNNKCPTKYNDGSLKHLCEKLSKIRNKHNDSQNNISSILNISQRTYSSYETGTVEIPLHILAKFCKHYNISCDYMLDRKENDLILK